MGCGQSTSSQPPPRHNTTHDYNNRDRSYDNNHYGDERWNNTTDDRHGDYNNRDEGYNHNDNGRARTTDDGYDYTRDETNNRVDDTNYGEDEKRNNFDDDVRDDRIEPDNNPEPIPRDPTPPPPKPPTPREPTPPPPREPTPPPNIPTPSPIEDETPFDDENDVVDEDGYRTNSLGLMSKTADFRHDFTDDPEDDRPQADPDHPYEDRDFPLDIAIVEDSSNIEWKRPKDFLSNPKLFTDGATRFDVGQGSAGTCWFLSTVANIASNPDMLNRVIPENSYQVDDPDRYDGVFHARFFRFGKWDDVYIDDYLPTVYGNCLWGAKSATDDNEMWVPLLEKAFARLHGSYDAIYGGQPGDAYLQLTGGIGERIDMDDHVDKAGAMFLRIKNAINSGCQVSCVVPDEYDNHLGLVGGHAYSLVGTCEVGRTKLLRVRNPWGHGEWKGPWCDGSSEWETIPDTSVSAPNKDDGEFYVALSDFVTYFSQTTICSLTPDFDMDGSSDALNHVLNIYGEWSGPSAAGFHKMLHNPKYGFTVTEEGMLDDGYVPFVVQIIQHSEKRKTDHVSIRCDIFRVVGDKNLSRGRCMALEIQGKKNNVYTPELQSSFRHKLKPGRYVIIPSTVDEGIEKQFLLRLYSPGPLKNVKEVQRNISVMSSENEEVLEANRKTYYLTVEKALFGEFIAGMNAGGQVSNRATYQQNPQYLIHIPDTGEDVALVVHVMQKHEEPQYPIGFRIFQKDSHTKLPVDIEYLYDKYNDSPHHLEGSQSKFMVSWDMDARYLLPAGDYIGLVHMDQPDTEKPFSIVFKSDSHIKIKGYQTG